ncbi:MAG TPA: hypothetical protein VG406_18640 [Isosphaeraceae bacterium]|jgi:hypothetical protein|nr:hypothetical protein [Isosphaeraceae bacterium]
MPPDDSNDVLELVLRQCQIIIAALIAGVTLFAALDLLVLSQLGKAAATSMLSWVAVGSTAFWAALAWLVPRLIADRVVRDRAEVPRGPGDLDRLLAGFRAKTVVAGALLEGPVFFALIAYMIERSPIALAAAAPALLYLMLQFPTRPALEAWLDDQLWRLDQRRQLDPD